MKKTKGFKYICKSDSEVLKVVPPIKNYPVKSPCSFDGFPVYEEDGWLLNVRGQLVFCSHDEYGNDDVIEEINPVFDSRICAFFTKTSKGKILLCNGDTEDENGGFNGVFPRSDENTSVSFRCIATLLNLDISNKKFVNALTSLKVIECTADTTNYNDKRLKKITNQKQFEKAVKTLVPPQPGFTLQGSGVEAYWHRSGSCLFTANGKYFLIGQDEGTYFGVELPARANSINEAYKLLTPKELLKRADWKRQGEWYVVPVKKEDISKENNTSFIFFDKITDIGLPIDDPDSNIHKVIADEILIKNNKIYALNGCLSHEEHAQVTWEGWATFIKNRAVRSVSVQGVD